MASKGGTKIDPHISATRALAKETQRIANQLEKQNNLSRRFVVGILFGVGTALGASLIATIIIVIFSRLVSGVGIDLLKESQSFQHYLQQQIEQSRPNE